MGYANPKDYQNKYRTDPVTYFRRVWHNQKKTAKARGMSPPDYSLEELIEWLKQQPHLTKLWTTWQESGHQRKLAPSLDRIDDSVSYTLSNITLMTWEENNQKSHKDLRAGKLNTNSVTSAKRLGQFHKDGSIIAEYTSAGHASEILNLPKHAYKNIRAAAAGKLQTAYGYVWRDLS